MNYASMWRNTNLTKRMATYFLENYSRHLKWKDYKEDILDIGCADGSITSNILYPKIEKHVRKLLAIDILEGMIDLARKENRIQTVDYQVLDITDRLVTSKYRNRFDHIFSFAVAHLIPDTRSFFSVLHDMLKPNGQIFVTAVHNSVEIESFLKQLEEEKWKKYKPKKEVFADLTVNPEKHIREVLEDVGFKIDVCESKVGTYHFENFKDFARALSNMYVRLVEIPEEARDEFIREHIEKCVAGCSLVEEPDKFEGSYGQLISIATKTSR